MPESQRIIKEKNKFSSFLHATAISKITGAYLWGCAYGECLTVALPAIRETTNQSKSLLFCKVPDKIFLQMLDLKGAT